MATVTSKPRPVSAPEARSRVQDPLRRLRGYIRGYVIGEALTILVICLATAFWLGLLIDYGSFKLFGIDWVKDLPRWLRAVFLATGLLAVGFIVEVGKSLRFRTNPNEVRAVQPLLFRHPGLLIALLGSFAGCFYLALILLAVWRDASGVGTAGSVVVGLVVLAFLLGLVALVVVKRQLYDFRDAALALVLERKYPGLLGDRLITAVELGDAKMAARYGYSPAMIDQTVKEAAERVDRLSLREVFDWKRLWLQGGLALVATLGIYLASLITLMCIAVAQDKSVGAEQLNDLHDSAAIWTERHVLLDNERWPTRCIIELVDFPATGELKVGLGSAGGKEQATVELHARAVEYAVADRNVALRWRPMTLADTHNTRFNISTTVEPKDLPAGWYRPALRRMLDRLAAR